MIETALSDVGINMENRFLNPVTLIKMLSDLDHTKHYYLVRSMNMIPIVLPSGIQAVVLILVLILDYTLIVKLMTYYKTLSVKTIKIFEQKNIQILIIFLSKMFLPHFYTHLTLSM